MTLEEIRARLATIENLRGKVPPAPKRLLPEPGPEIDLRAVCVLMEESRDYLAALWAMHREQIKLYEAVLSEITRTAAWPSEFAREALRARNAEPPAKKPRKKTPGRRIVQ